MDAEKLQREEIIVRICPITKKPTLAIYYGNDNVLDLHNETIEQDFEDVIKFIEQSNN